MRKPHFDGAVQSKIVFPESEVFCRRLAVPVIFIIVIKQKEVIIFTYGDVFADVLLWYKGGGGGNEVTTLKRNLYGGAVPYRWDSDDLGRVTGPDGYINFKVELFDANGVKVETTGLYANHWLNGETIVLNCYTSQKEAPATVKIVADGYEIADAS